MKKILTLLLAALMLFSLVACSAKDGGAEPEPDAGTVTTLKLWTPISGPDATIFNNLITKFNQEYSESIKVEATHDVRDTHYTNLKQNVPGNRVDIAIIHSQLVQNYVVNDYLEPFDATYLGEDKINPDNYLTKVIDTLYNDNQLYGVPLDVHPLVVYYNKDIVGDKTLPTNFTEFMKLAKELTTNNVYGLPLSTLWPSEFVYSTALYQNGGQEIDADSNPLFNSTAGQTAAKVLQDIIHTYKVSPQNLGADDDLNLFTTGKGAFHLNGSWMYSDLKDNLGDKLGIMSLSNLLTDSTGETKDDVMARSHVFTVAKTSRSKSNAKKQAIATFIKWMGEYSYEWAAAGQIPAYNPVREKAEYKAISYIADFGDPNDFRTPAAAAYFESGYETVFEYITSIMKDSSANIIDKLNAAKLEAEKRVYTEKNS